MQCGFACVAQLVDLVQAGLNMLSDPQSGRILYTRTRVVEIGELPVTSVIGIRFVLDSFCQGGCCGDYRLLATLLRANAASAHYPSLVSGATKPMHCSEVQLRHLAKPRNWWSGTIIDQFRYLTINPVQV